jgi:hypothetical protein
MAVFCGVCAGRIDCAPENEGSFQTTGKDFGGWDVKQHGGSRIEDTCEDCAPALRAAVTEAARKIAGKHKIRIQALKKEMTVWKNRQERIEKAKNEFEKDWSEQRRKLGLVEDGER